GKRRGGGGGRPCRGGGRPHAFGAPPARGFSPPGRKTRPAGQGVAGMPPTTTSAPPHPFSESGHGVMITHFRGILADSFELGDLFERQIADDPQRHDGALSRGQAGDAPSQPVAKAPALGRALDLWEVTLGDVVDRNSPLATPVAL